MFSATLLTPVSKLPAETDGVGAAQTGPKCDPLYPRQSISTYFIGSCHLTSVEKCVVETTFSVQTWKSTRYNFKLSTSIMHPQFHVCSHMSKLGCKLNVEKFILKWRISCALEDKILVIWSFNSHVPKIHHFRINLSEVSLHPSFLYILVVMEIYLLSWFRHFQRRCSFQLIFPRIFSHLSILDICIRRRKKKRHSFF